jgi:hypothetical protein
VRRNQHELENLPRIAAKVTNNQKIKKPKNQKMYFSIKSKNKKKKIFYISKTKRK